MVPFKKILIANRGEIAVRIIRACRELGIKTVGVYSEADRDSIHVRLADEAVCIGPPPATESYLNVPAILSAAEITNAEAIHPGYGFLSENAQFAEACVKSGIVFIGPRPENIRFAGDKARARRFLKKKGIPVVPGSDGVVKDFNEAKELCKNIGYPVMLKAASGGGGRGMRVVRTEEELYLAFTSATTEANAAFGDSNIYIEKFIPEMKHIEVQILADIHGNVVALGERDCSVQRRHQKVIEEAPASFISDRTRKRLFAKAIKCARALRYTNVGTVEFIVDMEENIYFMEINSRVQVEHPVTEAVTGVDIIKEQILLAGGKELNRKEYQIEPRYHAIEFRINAEDPETLMPSAGKVEFLYLPGGTGVRVDTALYGGYHVPPYYDSLIAKLIVRARSREEAINRAARALDEFIIEGIKTNIPLHKKIIQTEEFRSGRYTTRFLESIL
jgi:acetyl-CoA carboxylase biotin carboxylase subunit